MQDKKTNLLSYGNGRTREVSFIAAHKKEIFGELKRWGHTGGYEYQLLPKCEWRDVFLKLSSPPRRSRGALISTTSRWTVFIDNNKMGGWPASFLFSMSELLHTECCAFSLSCNGQSPTCRGFGYWDGRFGECQIRNVQLIHDSKWEFHASGKPLSFEDESRYDNRLTRQKFNNDMAIQYAKGLGIQLEQTTGFLCEGDEIVFDEISYVS